MKKWIFILFGLFSVIFCTSVYFIYRFLNVPLDQSRIEQIIKTVDAKWSKPAPVPENQLLLLPAWQAELKKMVSDNGEEFQKQHDAYLAQSIFGQTPLSSEEIAKFKKYVSTLGPQLEKYLTLLRTGAPFVLKGWTDIYDEAFPNKPDVAPIIEAVQSSLVYAQWLALTGDWDNLNLLLSGNLKIAQSFLNTPSHLYLQVGAKLRKSILDELRKYFEILPPDYYQSTHWPALKSSINDLLSIQLKFEDVIASELAAFDQLSSSFDDEIVKEFAAKGIKAPKALIKILFVRDRKIGLKRLLDILDFARKETDPEKLKAFLKTKDEKWPPLSVISKLSAVSYISTPDKLAELQKASDDFKPNWETISSGGVLAATANLIKIPLSLFDLYAVDELLLRQPVREEIKNMTLADLTVWQTSLHQSFFQAELFDAFKVGDEVKGVLIHQLSPNGFYEKLGLKIGDIVIGVDGQKKDFLDFESIVNWLAQNKSVKFQVVRENKLVLVKCEILQ